MHNWHIERARDVTGESILAAAGEYVEQLPNLGIRVRVRVRVRCLS